MKNKKCKLLLVLAASSLFALTSCGEKPQDTTTSDDTTPSSEVVKTYYSITLTAGDNYKIEADFGYDASKVEEGKNFKFKVTPTEGYDVISVKAGSVTLTGKNGVYTIENVKANVIVTVEVAIQTLKVTFEGEHFTATPKEGFTPDNVNFGGSYEFTITPDEHYHLVAVKVGEKVLTATEGVYKITEIKANTVVKVETEIDSFAVTFEGEHATATVLEGYDATKVNYGAELKFKVEADAHYNVASVKDGETVLTATEGVYTLSNVTKATTIKIEVELDSHKVTFVGEGFTVTDVEGFNKESITHGNEYKFKLTVKKHFHVTSVKIGETSLTADTSGIYTISNITEDKTVTIATEEDTYKLTFSTSENYTVELEETTLDLNTVTYSKEVKFKVSAAKYYSITAVKLNGEALTVGEDGYYLVKNQVSDSTIAIEATRNKATVTFNTTGGTAIAAKTIDQGTKVEEVVPTRAADEYYDAYTFDGWYLNGEKFNFETIIETDITLVAKWKYGNSKTTYVDEWAMSSFVAGGTGAAQNLDLSASHMAFQSGAVNQELKEQIIAEFGKTDADGVFFNPKGITGTLQTPAINFKELLKTHSKICMEVGGYQTYNQLLVNVGNGNGDNRTKINWNGNESSVSLITRTRLTFMQGADGNVYMGYEDTTFDQPLATYDARIRVGNLALSEAQANGTEGLIFSTTQGGSRPYWLGRPYATAGESTLVNVSGKTGFTVTDATIKTKAEVTKDTGIAPFNQWYDQICYEQQAIGILGTNTKGASVLSIDPIDLSSIFAAGKGVKFTIGAWNNDSIFYVEGETATSIGMNALKPNDPFAHTKESITKTWFNWTVYIDPATGVAVHNGFEGTDYTFKLTEGQLNGTESIKFNLSTLSNQHFFLLTNIVSYHL